MKNIGQNIKRLRQSKGWTQPELAKRAGIAQGTISDYERGIIKSIKIDQLSKLATAFSVSVAVLDNSLTIPRGVNEGEYMSEIEKLILEKAKELTPYQKHQVLNYMHSLKESTGKSPGKEGDLPEISNTA